MKKFKFTVSKNQQRYDIILQSNSENEAKERVHKEGYSILNIEEVNDIDIKGSKFLFTIESDNEIKNGVIYGEDIFKVYLKLRKDFGYKVISLFAEIDKDKSDFDKQETLKKVEEEYSLFIQKFQKQVVETKVEKAVKKEKQENVQLEDFYLKKEVEETYKLIDFVLKKIKSVIDNNMFSITPEQSEKLNNIYNSLITIKNSRNINKLREIGELALVKIGKIELDYYEKTKNNETRILLKETNGLLKKIGSKEQFVEKDKDIGYLIKNFLSQLKENFTTKNKGENSILDKETHSYIKTLVLLKKYKEKKDEIDKEIIKNFTIFIFPIGKNKEKKEIILAKKSVISQNISLLKAKLNGKVFSYTKIVKGYKKIEELFVDLLRYLAMYLKGIIFLYSLIFIVFVFINYIGISKLNINIEGINIIIYLIILYLLFSYTKGFFSFIFNFVFFVFLNIFFVVNF
nr:hypothetical protein [Candidatus Gracilibacteria bacterium]